MDRPPILQARGGVFGVDVVVFVQPGADALPDGFDGLGFGVAGEAVEAGGFDGDAAEGVEVGPPAASARVSRTALTSVNTLLAGTVADIWSM